MIEEILKWLLGGGGLIAVGKIALDYSKSKAPVNAAHDAATSMMEKLQQEAAKWQQLYDETHKLLEAQRDTNTLLRSQNAMMRMLLVQKGVTEPELIAIGAIHPSEHHDAK